MEGWERAGGGAKVGRLWQKGGQRKHLKMMGKPGSHCNSHHPLPSPQRYYHLFVEGELEVLASKLGPVASVEESGFDHQNWWLLLRKH